MTRSVIFLLFLWASSHNCRFCPACIMRDKSSLHGASLKHSLLGVKVKFRRKAFFRRPLSPGISFFPLCFLGVSSGELGLRTKFTYTCPLESLFLITSFPILSFFFLIPSSLFWACHPPPSNMKRVSTWPSNLRFGVRSFLLIQHPSRSFFFLPLFFSPCLRDMFFFSVLDPPWSQDTRDIESLPFFIFNAEHFRFTLYRFSPLPLQNGVGFPSAQSALVLIRRWPNRRTYRGT